LYDKLQNNLVSTVADITFLEAKVLCTH